MYFCQLHGQLYHTNVLLLFSKKKIQPYIERFIWTVGVVIILSINTNASSCGAEINNVLAEVVY